MNPFGGPMVGWKALMMFSCLALNFALIFKQGSSLSSSLNSCSVCVKSCTYHNVGVTIVTQK